MKLFDMAANSIKVEGFANLYNLQLFADDEEYEQNESEYAGDEVEDTDETVLDTEESEEVANSEENQTEDITQTQAFSRRLKEETDRVRQESSTTAVDNYIKEQYKGQEWNGKPILSQADLNQALYEQKLQNAGQSQEDMQALVDEHPAVQAAKLAAQTNETNQKLYNEFLELSEEYKDIKDFNQITPEVWDMKNNKNISFLDAYNRIHIKKIKLQTEQETIRNINKNATSSPGSASSGGVVHKTKSVSDMTSEEFDSYREEVRKQTREY